MDEKPSCGPDDAKFLSHFALACSCRGFAPVNVPSWDVPSIPIGLVNEQYLVAPRKEDPRRESRRRE